MFGLADGAAGATQAPPNYPAMLAPYGPYRPPWNVAGVDYYAGVIPGTQLVDWRSLGSNPNVTINASQGLVSPVTNGWVFNGIDFSTGIGAVVRNNNGSGVTTFGCNNCKFGTPIPDSLQLQGTGGVFFDQNYATVTITNCTFDGIANGNGNIDSAGFVNTSGNTIVMYNYFIHGAQSTLTLGFGNSTVNYTVVYKYNLIVNHILLGASHRNDLQWESNGPTVTSCKVGFNTSYQDITVLGGTFGGGEGFQFFQSGDAMTLNNTSFFNNTLISKRVPQTPTGTTTPISTWVHCSSSVTANGATNTNNYFDPTGAAQIYYPGQTLPSNGWTSSGNRDMTTNKIITPA